jgi:exosortase
MDRLGRESKSEGPLAGTGNMTIDFRACVLLLLWAATFYPIFPEMVSEWIRHSDNSHGLLVPFVSLYFTWTRREALGSARRETSGWGLALLVMSLLVYIVATIGDVAVVARCMIVFALFGLVLYNYGGRIARILALPIFLLLFMVPVPDSIIGLVSFPLQLLATRISAIILEMVSIPVYREGNILCFANTQLEVAEACSGIRSLVSLVMLGVVFTAVFPSGRIRKAVVLGSCVPIALLGNIARVTCTGILAHKYGDQVARGFLHSMSGLLVFLIGFTLLLLEYQVLGFFSRKTATGKTRGGETNQ